VAAGASASEVRNMFYLQIKDTLMKKLIFTLAALCAPVFLFSQGLGIGIKAGANFSNYSTDNFDTSSKTSYHAGVYANINFSEKWGITPEILWSAQGAKFDGVGDFNTKFVTVPIMLRWRVIPLISLEAGPQFNFLTDAEFDGDDVSDQMKNNTYSLDLGAVVHLPLGFNGGIRYVMGMTDLEDDSDEELKDRTFQVYLGWTIFGDK
jgi:hypothetical protein